MANRIAGITVEIGGDTTKLSTALKSVNSEIKSTQSQLRDVNNLLKLDPGNTELITQKHKLLAQAVSETKEKLAQLKEAAQQANEKLASGEISQQQYDALQREIIATEQQLEKLEQQADQSAVALQKLAATGENMKKLGDNISSAGSTLTKTVTAPVIGLGTAAVKTAADFDSAMAQVQAVSGASGDEFEALREKAREMGAGTKFSATEAAEAMNYMAMAGWKTSDMISGIEGIMNLAAASGEDLATTSDIVTDALTAFGLTAADSGHFADILAAASSNANTNVSMMGETFKYCAPIAGA
ncbi:MAG: phage tail tape measure protein, partial [Lachnospiraceae bacterium]